MLHLLMLQSVRAAMLLPLQALLGLECYCKAATPRLLTFQRCPVPATTAQGDDEVRHSSQGINQGDYSHGQ